MTKPNRIQQPDPGLSLSTNKADCQVIQPSEACQGDVSQVYGSRSIPVHPTYRIDGNQVGVQLPCVCVPESAQAMLARGKRTSCCLGIGSFCTGPASSCADNNRGQKRFAIHGVPPVVAAIAYRDGA